MKTKTRAIAHAIAKNNILIFIPCHRIINKEKNIINYRAGKEMKLLLQTWEK